MTDVVNEDLRALYSLADTLIFPSLQEGFGWPIIEAQACGCPVVTSNIAPMTEVGGNGAVYINPREETSAASIIAEMQGRRELLKQAGFANAARFSMESMTSGYLGAYSAVLNMLK
ncbi:glycosyltransferase [Methylococcus sp. ANG]|uniref:glycosyltransferase n=1 Tax=Methylococcus sp. ANG TaxID=3231903 RepID=UPI00345A4783